MIKLNEDTHTYYDDATGREIPGVGKILRELGVIPERPVNVAAMELGRIVHKATELHDYHSKKPDSFYLHWMGGEPVDGYLQTYRQFLEQARPEILDIERVVYDVYLDCCGRPDRRIRLNGRLTVLDLKTGGREEWHWLKVAAYAMAFEREETAPWHDLALLYLRPRGYTLDVCRSPMPANRYRGDWLRLAREYKS